VRLIPAVPRLPVLPDPLRRVRISADLGAVTTVGAEDDPRDAGLDPEAVEIGRASCRERVYRAV
jgi:hypothetical protein